MVKLPNIQFCDYDPATILKEMVASVEASLGRTLQPADPVRLYLQSLVPVLVQQRVLIDQAAKRSLVAYATGQYLDNLAGLRGLFRESATPAKTVLRFTTTQSAQLRISKNTPVAPTEGQPQFRTVAYAHKGADQDYVEVEAVCTEKGIVGNGYLPGQLTNLITPLPYAQVTNLVESSGGAEVESDEKLRQRIIQAPEGYSVAGPIGGYRFWAIQAHVDIVDASVRTVAPGVVEVRPLLAGGVLPDEQMLQTVEGVIRSKVPLTDTVKVLAPELVEYDVDATFYLLQSEDSPLVEHTTSAVESSLQSYVDWQRNALGRDVNPSRLIYALQSAGAHRVEISSPGWQKLEPHQLAIEKNINLRFGGLEDG